MLLSPPQGFHFEGKGGGQGAFLLLTQEVPTPFIVYFLWALIVPALEERRPLLSLAAIQTEIQCEFQQNA